MKRFISFATLLVSMNAFAVESTRMQTATTNRSSTPSASLGYVLPASSGGGSAADSGRSTANTQLISAAVNVGAATMYMGVCTGCSTGAGCWACPLVPLAGVAASMLGNAAGQSAGAGSDMSAYAPGSYGITGYDAAGNPTYGAGAGASGSNGTNGASANSAGADGLKLPDGTTPASIASAVARINADLAKTGAVISEDGKTMTTKDGRKFDLAKGGAGGPGALEGMGLSAAEANQATEMGKKYSAASAAKYGAMAAKLATEGGGGGAGRPPAADGSGGGAGGAGNYGMMDPRNKARAKANVSGLTKKLGDDTIGVSGDNIFEMVTRRYKARDQVNQFLKD